MSKGMSGWGNVTIKVWSGGCAVYPGNIRSCIGSLGGCNDEEEKKTKERGQTVEEVECGGLCTKF